MAQTAAPQRPSIFVRSNFAALAPSGEPGEDETGTTARSFEANRNQILGVIEDAVTDMEHGEGTEAGLARLWATLMELESMVERNPGVSMAVGDLYQAAAALVGVGREVAVFRNGRLLKDASRRLRDRLASAQPRKAWHPGLS